MQEIVTRLIEIQRREGMTARAMAARLGIREDNWCHMRRRSQQGGRPSIVLVQRAVKAFPELYPLVLHELSGEVA
jgi:hypothetical protein